MKRSLGLFVSILLVAGFVLLHNPCSSSKTWVKREKLEKPRLVFVQQEDKEDKSGTDPHLLQIYKKLQEKLDEWLKSLNERIENEDVTRLEVRFLEVLRNFLEWVKEKVDARVESGERARPKKREKGLIQDTGNGVSPVLYIG